MSIKLMTQAWETDSKENELIILLCLADFANDDGFCFPSWDAIQKKCKVSRDTVWRVLKKLEEKGRIASFSRKRTNGSDASNGYYILVNLDRAKSENQTPPKVRLRGGQSPIERGAKSDRSDPYMNHHVEPSIEPSIESVALTVCDDSHLVAEYLYQKLSKHQPNFKKPNIQVWAKDIDLAIRIDSRTKEQLMACIDWIYSTPKGNFWIANILSGRKLREKFDTMNMQAGQQTQVQAKSSMVDAIYGQGVSAKELIERMEKVS